MGLGDTNYNTVTYSAATGAFYYPMTASSAYITNETRRVVALPTVDPKEEPPLSWLRRRVAEVREVVAA